MMTAQSQSDRLVGYFLDNGFTITEVDDLDQTGWELAATITGVPLPQTGLRLWVRNRLAEIHA